MQRRTNSSVSKNGITSSSNGGSYSETKKRYKTQQVNNHHQRHYHSSSSIIPKSLIGTLFIFGIGAIFILVSKLVSSSSSGTGTDSSTARRSIRSVTNKNIDQPLSSSTATAGGSSTPLKIVNGDHIGLTSPVTNVTLHIIFSTDCKSLCLSCFFAHIMCSKAHAHNCLHLKKVVHSNIGKVISSSMLHSKLNNQAT